MITEEHPTRKRLIEEGLRLFAERGYAATTVGDIERAAGLVPRRGGMYRHLGSKQELLQVCIERHVDEARALAELDLGDQDTLRDTLLLQAEALVGFMEHTRAVSLVLEREGDLVPELRDRFRDDVVEAGYRRAAEIVAPHVGEADAATLAVVLMGSIVSYVRAGWTFGRAPLAVERETLLATWADTAVRAVTPHSATDSDDPSSGG